MGKKKFIDKKHATTYSLVFRTTEDEDGTNEDSSGQPNMNAAAQAHHAAQQRRYPVGHPLAWIEDEEKQGEMTEERRRELIELGFPDDGYDYLRHVRTLGHGKAGLESSPAEATNSLPSSTSEVVPGFSLRAEESTPTGPSVFVPAPMVQAPDTDTALFDASALTILEEAKEDEEAARMIGGVSAFARPRDVESTKHSERKELEELEAMMDHFEDEGIGEEEGDLLDDFVLTATEKGVQAGGDDDDEEACLSLESFSSDDYDYDNDNDEDDKTTTKRAPSRPGSIASTYWREERTDRRNLLTVIDERFERLALEYDDREIGDMDEDAEEGTLGGFADVSEFNDILDEFLKDRHVVGNSSRRVGKAGDDDDADDDYVIGGDIDTAENRMQNRERKAKKTFLEEEMEACGFDTTDAEAAIRMAKQALYKAEEQERQRQLDIDGDVPLTFDKNDYVYVEEEKEEKWDCESVLSLRSNVYNHPGTISEAPRQRKPPAHIKLDKNGIPTGVFRPPPPHHHQGGIGNGETSTDSNRDGKGVLMDGDVDLIQEKVVPILERKKGETAEEKKARKASVKEAKRDARATKKELKSMYKEEAVKAQRRTATAHVQPSVFL